MKHVYYIVSNSVPPPAGFVRSRNSRDYAEAYPALSGTAQIIPQVDAEIAEKGHFWMETNCYSAKVILPAHCRAKNGRF